MTKENPTRPLTEREVRIIVGEMLARFEPEPKRMTWHVPALAASLALAVVGLALV